MHNLIRKRVHKIVLCVVQSTINDAKSLHKLSVVTELGWRVKFYRLSSSNKVFCSTHSHPEKC